MESNTHTLPLEFFLLSNSLMMLILKLFKILLIVS
jgi:hypothetical protein